MIKSKKASDYEGINIIDVDNEPSPHDPTNVLEIEVVRVWNRVYIWRISYQDKDILYDWLEDKELNFCCDSFPNLSTTGHLSLRGNLKENDLNIGFLDYEDLIKLATKVDAINKKYRKEKLFKEQCLDRFQEMIE